LTTDLPSIRVIEIGARAYLLFVAGLMYSLNRNQCIIY